MEPSPLQPRLGLSIPVRMVAVRPLLKEMEAAGFAWVQIPAPPSVGAARSPGVGPATPAASARRSGTTGLRRIVHGPGSLQVGSRDGDRAMEGLLSYAAEAGAELVVYHAANFPDQPASEDRLLAETRSLANAAHLAERLGVVIAIENLAPVFPGPDALSFTPSVLRTMANRISSPRSASAWTSATPTSSPTCGWPTRWS